MTEPGLPMGAEAAANASGAPDKRTDSDGVPVGADDVAEDVERSGGDPDMIRPATAGDVTGGESGRRDSDGVPVGSADAEEDRRRSEDRDAD